ncbi:MAG: diguanylate cyclase [Acidobacteria bacterium]|nr:diguanylate cyclase [Acidobacteriota bacterium]
MAPAEVDPSAPGAVKILIAEDEPVSRLRLQSTLQRWGYKVTTAGDGAEALHEMQKPDRPGIAILDWMMPHVDGLDVCRSIRATADRDYTYVILLTSLDREEDIVAGFDAGADDYITKPFSLHELHARIRTGVRIVRLHEQLRAAAMHDSLTGLLNRRAFFEIFEKEVSRAKRQQLSLGILMVDLDHFKQVNDQHGHLAGDAVLREAARRLRRRVRATDVVGRYGGEEFVVALPGSDLKQAVSIAEEFRHCIASEPFEVPSGRLTMTTSVGVVTTWDMAEAEHLLKTADEALYRAKAAGRNRVVADLRTAA